MGDECNYSFWDLYEAAHKRLPTEVEKREFHEETQDKRNLIVKTWAVKAKWGTGDRVGKDSLIYTAFCPLWAKDQKPSR